MKKSILLLVCLFALLFAKAQNPVPFIVVDQFGYLPEAPKYAVIRNPKTGYDADLSFSPGTSYALVNADTRQEVYTSDLSMWKGGSTDVSSGDKVWYFDFTEVTENGDYYVLDKSNNVRSFSFRISAAAYNEVLKTAVRAFFYQRVGFAKNRPYADEGWTDGASHIGSMQDTEARRYNAKSDDATARDVSGGWYDAGDYNKYTNWTANYVVDFMRAYLDTPNAWGDDYNLPESGNGIPDLIDEAKWGIDHLLRMQLEDGSVLSIVGLSHASPPSSASGQSLYGTASTSATLNTASAFAISARVFTSLGMEDYAAQLETAAINAWNWAVANPSVIFYNNDGAYGTSGLGAGQQEVDDYGRLVAKLEAALMLYELTGDTQYRDFFDANYDQVHMILWNYAYPFELDNQETLLHYTLLDGATEAVKSNILSVFAAAMKSDDNLAAYTNKKDPYLAHLPTYTWGSSAFRCSQGLMFANLSRYVSDQYTLAEMKEIMGGFVHYMHGLNPLNMVYLSNMYGLGAENSVNEFYHAWFTDGSDLWDRVGESTYGPAPGFVVGGPNPSYSPDGCCPDGCGGSNNDVCTSMDLNPPQGQPDQKSYLDFNTSWPLNSWSVTENSNAYQLRYIRLLAHFVDGSYDCSGTANGSAAYDVCGKCAGGTTGVTPTTNIEDCGFVVEPELNTIKSSLLIYPNPAQDYLWIEGVEDQEYAILLIDAAAHVSEFHIRGKQKLDLSAFAAGIYVCQVTGATETRVLKILKR